MNGKTESTVLAEAWQRIHANDAPPSVHTRLCSCCGRAMVSEEGKLREQLAEVTAQRDALVKSANMFGYRLYAAGYTEVMERLDEVLGQRDVLLAACEQAAADLLDASQQMREESPAPEP